MIRLAFQDRNENYENSNDYNNYENNYSNDRHCKEAQENFIT